MSFGCLKNTAKTVKYFFFNVGCCGANKNKNQEFKKKVRKKLNRRKSKNAIKTKTAPKTRAAPKSSRQLQCLPLSS